MHRSRAMTIFPNTYTRKCGPALGSNIARSGPISIGSVRGLSCTNLQNFRSFACDLRPAVCPIAKSEKCQKIAKSDSRRTPIRSVFHRFQYVHASLKGWKFQPPSSNNHGAIVNRSTYIKSKIKNIFYDVNITRRLSPPCSSGGVAPSAPISGLWPSCSGLWPSCSGLRPVEAGRRPFTISRSCFARQDGWSVG